MKDGNNSWNFEAGTSLKSSLPILLHNENKESEEEVKAAIEYMQHMARTSNQNLENWEENEIEQMKGNTIPDGWKPKTSPHHTLFLWYPCIHICRKKNLL